MIEIERAWSKHPGWFDDLPRDKQVRLMALDTLEIDEHNERVKKQRRASQVSKQQRGRGRS